MTVALLDRLKEERGIIQEQIVSTPVTYDVMGKINFDIGKLQFIDYLLDEVLDDDLRLMLEEKHGST